MDSEQSHNFWDTTLQRKGCCVPNLQRGQSLFLKNLKSLPSAVMTIEIIAPEHGICVSYNNIGSH